MIKTVIEIPAETLQKLEDGFSNIAAIRDALDKAGSIKTPERYTIVEFCDRAKIGRNKFEAIKDRLNLVRVSPRKILVPHSDLVRWFNGELA